MKTRKRWLAIIIVLMTTTVLVQCGSDNNGGSDWSGPQLMRTWVQIARFIDQQLGDVSDGTANKLGYEIWGEPQPFHFGTS